MLTQETKDRIIAATRKYLTPSAGYKLTKGGAAVGGNQLSYVIESVTHDLRLVYTDGRPARITEDYLVACGFRIVAGFNHRNQACRLIIV